MIENFYPLGTFGVANGRYLGSCFLLGILARNKIFASSISLQPFPYEPLLRSMKINDENNTFSTAKGRFPTS